MDGVEEGENDGAALVGQTLGITVGGTVDGVEEGENDGAALGFSVDRVGSILGSDDGMTVEGGNVGTLEGEDVGELVDGVIDGAAVVGRRDGENVGILDGRNEIVG